MQLGVEPENIACGGGIDGLLGLVVRLFIEPGNAVATSLGAYPTFNFHVAASGGKLVTTPYVNDKEDPARFCSWQKRKMPNCSTSPIPTTPWVPSGPPLMFSGLSKLCPTLDMLLLDEAYVEFAPEGTAPAIDVDRKNLLRFRTFSKAHGMAGIRVGYVIGHPEMISAFDKIRNHFGISRIQQAGAIAAISDQGMGGPRES